MKVIAYEVKLNLKDIIESKKQKVLSKIEANEKRFYTNKEKLLPHLVTLLHYIVELNNTMRFGKNNKGSLKNKSCGKDMDFQETINRYSKDFYFCNYGSDTQFHKGNVCKLSNIICCDIRGLYEVEKLILNDDDSITITTNKEGVIFNTIEDYITSLTHRLVELQHK